ncbi:proline-rich protein 2-like [Microtus ochrogaster]|uniref:Proline-rich protein 2-like n=1 Tax=Microtus ochrogaster TaxID=79684 RepID=A0ABM1UIE0_MICOH|nr:proline-rich protein 2-like [Microtus ochrogaster]
MGLQGNAQPGAPKESRGPRRPSARGGGRHLPSEAVPRVPRVPASERSAARRPRGPDRNPQPSHRRRRRRVSRQVGSSEPVAQPVTAAGLRRRRLSPTTTWRPRPPQEAGGRGGERRAGSDGPPACLPGRPRGTDSPPRGSATLRDVPAHPGDRGALDREGVGRSASLPATSEASELTALPGAATTHLAPPLRGHSMFTKNANA